jgi:hypothetical protein
MKRIPAVWLSVLACALVVGACGSSGGRAPAGSRDVLTAEEIRESTGHTAYDVIQQLRPQFLRLRPARSVQAGQVEPVVYVDNIRVGGVASLRNIRSSDIEEIRHVGASDATTRFGTGHLGGAILIRLRS